MSSALTVFVNRQEFLGHKSAIRLTSPPLESSDDYQFTVYSRLIGFPIHWYLDYPEVIRVLTGADRSLYDKRTRAERPPSARRYAPTESEQ